MEGVFGEKSAGFEYFVRGLELRGEELEVERRRREGVLLLPNL